MTDRFRTRPIHAIATVVSMLALVGVAMPIDEPVDPPAVEEKAPPTLDELLGIERDDETQPAEDVAAEEAEDELQRRLNEDPIGNALVEAIQKMSLSADLLDRRFDSGLGTQRIQEDVLAKLEQLIDEAKKQQCKGGGSSGSSSQQKQSPSGQQPGKQEQAGSNQGQRSEGPSSDSGEGEPPARRDGEINTVLDETRSEWGGLPQRVRKLLLQGRQEEFSSLYEQMTREYYRRLAEEGSP